MQNRFEFFTLLISKLSKAIKKIKTKEVEEYSLNSSHVIIIYFLHKHKGLTLKGLCEACAEDKAIVSRSVEGLRKKGLITSQKDSSYKNEIVLNQKGIAVAECICEKIDNLVQLAGNGICEQDRIVMYSCLQTICENLSGISKKYEE